MVPYDVLVDPVSMPTHPILNIKLSNGGSSSYDEEDGDGDGDGEEEEEEIKMKSDEKDERKVRKRQFIYFDIYYKHNVLTMTRAS